jgi:hemerythrin-like metal-binding protein
MHIRAAISRQERIVERLGYPETEKHKAGHAAFVKKVSDFKQGFEAGKLGVSLQVMTFMSDWLQQHIKGSDKKQVSFFHENDVK